MMFLASDGKLLQIGDSIIDRMGDEHTFLMVQPDRKIITLYNGVTCRYTAKSFPDYRIINTDESSI